MALLGFTRKQPRQKANRGSMLTPPYDRAAATEALWGELSEPTIYAVQAERYSRSDLVYMCVRRIAEMAGTSARRLALFDANSPRDPETDIPTERVEDHPFLNLWRQPNPWDSRFEFIEGTITSLLLNGNAFWHWDDGERPGMGGDGIVRISRSDKAPLALWALRPDRVWIQPDANAWVSGYRYEAGGHKILFTPDVMRHYKLYHPLKDFEGLSPLEAANYAAMSDIAAQKSNWALFRNGVRLSGVVESDRDKVDLAEQELMEKMFEEKYAGDPLKGHQVAFLWQNFKYKELGISMRDAEFINGAKMNRMRIFGVFGIHPSVVLSEDSTRTDSQVGEYVTLKFTVGPMLERIASDMTPIVNQNWQEAPEVEAHFVNVVPQDREAETRIADVKAGAAEKLIRALGPTEGVEEAKRQGLLSPDAVAEPRLFPIPGIPISAATGNGAEEAEDESVKARLNSHQNGFRKTQYVRYP